MNTPPLNTRIKEETKKAHQELEKKVVLRLKAIRSETDYADFLNRFYTYFNAIEQLIAPYLSPAILPDLNQRRNSSYLRSDIEELGEEVTQLAELSLPEINTTAGALGAMYVIEGSIMGGPIIVEMLKKYGMNKGFSFFSGYGQATGEMWASFIATLNANADTDSRQAEAIEAANQTFSRFQYVFEG